MSWRIAKSLETLRDEVNAAWPARNTASDGVIGDAAHAASASDHNPNAAGVVCAFDITHDPNGPDGNDLAERLRLRQHPDAKYIIWSGRICSAYARGAALPWEWRPYSGADPHTNHIHVSVGDGPDGRSAPPYDDTDSWGVTTSPTQGDEMLDPNDQVVKDLFANFEMLRGMIPDSSSGKQVSVGTLADELAVLKADLDGFKSDVYTNFEYLRGIKPDPQKPH